jgi:hypothetical protein
VRVRRGGSKLIAWTWRAGWSRLYVFSHFFVAFGILFTHVTYFYAYKSHIFMRQVTCWKWQATLTKCSFSPLHCNCFITLYWLCHQLYQWKCNPWHIVNVASALSQMGIPPVYNTTFLKKKASCLLHLHVPCMICIITLVILLSCMWHLSLYSWLFTRFIVECWCYCSLDCIFLYFSWPWFVDAFGEAWHSFSICSQFLDQLLSSLHVLNLGLIIRDHGI